MIKKITKVSDFPILAKVLDNGKVVVAKGNQNYSVYTEKIHGYKILKMTEVEALPGERLNTIIFDMDNGTKKYFGVYSGEDGEKGKTGLIGPEGDKGQSFSESEVLNRADGVMFIVNDDVTDDPEKVWSAYRGKVMWEFIKSVSQVVMTDEEYQLRFNEQVFIDMEFTTTKDSQSVAIVHNDNVAHRTYVKYWTYEDDGEASYFYWDAEANEFLPVPNNFDIWRDYYLKEDKTEDEKYYTRRLETTVINPDTGESTSEWIYTLVTAPLWMDLEFTTTSEDQNSILLSNNKELGSDGDNLDKDKDKEEEIIIEHIPIKSIGVEKDTIIVPMNNIVIVPIIIEPIDYRNCPLVVEYDEEKITVFEDGRIMAIENNCETKVRIWSEHDPSISCTINVNVITYVESIEFDRSTIKAFKGNSYQIKTTVLPETATNKTIIWESSDEEIATVDENGTITLVSEGNVTIWARTVDGSGIYNKIDVTVDTAVTEIVLEDSYEVLVGIPTTIKAEVLPEEASNKKLIWESNHDNISADASGTNGIDGQIYLSDKVNGTITVTAADGSGVSKTIDIIGKIPVKYIVLNQTNVKLDLGETLQLTAEVNADADNKVLKWTSSNPNIISVDENGFIRTLLGGSVTIKCESTDGSGIVAECTVTSVTLITSIELDQDIRIYAGNTYQINYTVLPAVANSNLIWYTSNKDIATVSNGIITGVGEGICKVYAMADDNGGVTASANVIVTIATKELLLSDNEINLEVNETYTLIATVAPDDTTNQNVKFSSLDDTIATVDVDGYITGISEGTTSVFVKTTDGTNLSQECIVNIVKED